MRSEQQIKDWIDENISREELVKGASVYDNWDDLIHRYYKKNRESIIECMKKENEDDQYAKCHLSIEITNGPNSLPSNRIED